MAETIVASEIAGVVISLEVAQGDSVSADQALLIIESMKMHIPIESPRAGTVVGIMIAEGDVVAEGQALVKLD